MQLGELHVAYDRHDIVSKASGEGLAGLELARVLLDKRPRRASPTVMAPVPSCRGSIPSATFCMRLEGHRAGSCKCHCRDSAPRLTRARLPSPGLVNMTLQTLPPIGDTRRPSPRSLGVEIVLDALRLDRRAKPVCEIELRHVSPPWFRTYCVRRRALHRNTVKKRDTWRHCKTRGFPTRVAHSVTPQPLQMELRARPAARAALGTEALLNRQSLLSGAVHPGAAIDRNFAWMQMMRRMADGGRG